ncbi:MAG TPA: translocation/assembly module TamB domain-containing protein [Thermoanaerobaculia bacterium]|nr:translocation/assembly module TamB domain-containing protein [Thermoanaerobaculia bacterium]
MADTDKPPVTEEPHRYEREGLERQKGRPMWGCVRALLALFLVIGAILGLIGLGAYRYLGSARFAELVRARIEANLEARLGRDVFIGRVTVIRTPNARVILDDVRIGNAPGALQEWFATVRQVEIVGGIDSFLQRRVRLGHVDIRDPHFYFEVFPEGLPLTHNFPTWKPSGPRRFEIVRVDVSRLFVTGGHFDFLDRRHDIRAEVTGIRSEVIPTIREQIYRGTMVSPEVIVRLQDYRPFSLSLEGSFLYRPGSLDIQKIVMRGRGMDVGIDGRLQPITEGAYDLGIRSTVDLARLREIFAIERELQGSATLDATLRGRQADFTLEGPFSVPQLVADAYELGELRGTLHLTDERLSAKIDTARYGGGTLSGSYRLAEYRDPYAMDVDLAFDSISLEKLFEDWGLAETGLRGAATGTLSYAWEKDRILDGRGEGTARLRPGAVAFGSAPYPMPFAGSARFGLTRGVVDFRQAAFQTDKTQIELGGTLRIEDLRANLRVDVTSSDLAELDKIALNFARATGTPDPELLGLGGTGTIRGSVEGPLDSPLVVATVEAPTFIYNNIEIGSASIALRYDGPAERLTFERARFTRDDAVMLMTGSVTFPSSAPTRFDLAFVATNWPVAHAISVVELDLVASGLGTGELHVSGTPDAGTVRFEEMVITRERAELRLNGLVRWAPGEGNVTFDLAIAARSFPVADLVAFLDLGDIPISGELTGTLRLEGPRTALEGAGSITIRSGTIYDEPLDLATADILFTTGLMRVTHVEIQAPAGTLTGEAEYEFATERFSYLVTGTELDISRIGALSWLAGLIGEAGLRITSSGAGTLQQPEIVLEASIEGPPPAGLEIGDDAAPPTFYLAIRNGELIVRGSAWGAVEIEGTGTVLDGQLDGLVQLRIADLARFVTVFGGMTTVPVAGEIVVDLRLGGELGELTALRIEGTVPTFDIDIAGHPFVAEEPIRFTLHEGRVDIESFRLARDTSAFSISGFVSFVEDRRINLTIRGALEAALLQLFVPDTSAAGTVNIAAGITGTIDEPRVNGTAEILDGQVRIAGFPQLIGDIMASIVFHGDRLEIDSFRATLGGGALVAGGDIWLSGLSVERVRINMQGTDVAIRYFEGLSITGDLDLRLTGDAERALLQGDVRVNRALYFRDFDFTSSILNLLLERRGLAPVVAANWQERIGLSINVSAAETLAIRNNIADVTGSAQLELTGTLANPNVLGVVTIDEGGTVRFQDVDYRLVRGTINFQNPFRIDPYFDVTAEARVQEYDLTVNLTGTLDRITPTVTSDPPISDLTILSLIGPSSIGADRGGFPFSAQSLQMTGTSLLYQSLAGLIGPRILPFADAVRLELEGVTADPTVTVEKRIQNDLRVIVIYNTRTNQNREIIEWQVTPDWILELSRDSEKEDTYLINAVDARFRRRYEGRW